MEVINNICGFGERKEYKINEEYYPPIVPSLNDNSHQEDEINAAKGYVEGTKATVPVYTDGTNGKTKAWDMSSYDFMQGEAPKTVHPILWRMEKLNNINGLFQVLPEVEVGGKGGANGIIYQMRTCDLATMTLVKSATGWIIIDPLGGKETASAAWQCFKQNVDRNAEVRAILITHSHVDHYKGVEGIIDKSEILATDQNAYCLNPVIPAGKTLVIAPNGFYQEAISENLYLGNCMSRRAVYMYGSSLPHDACGQVGCGLGKTVGTETGSLLQPSFELQTERNDGFAALTIDGLTVTFQDVPGTEAPAEFHIYFDDYQALCPGENITHTMHNLLTSRGAKVRDPKAFAKAINEAINRFGQTQVLIGTHHWPVWNNEKCLAIMEKQRDMYQFFNDQVIRMVNKGMNMEEIAESFTLPESLNNELYNRGFYGSLSHNAKAVVQRYIGWWDGNPANYFKYPDEEVAQRFVACMGGEGDVLEKARLYFEKGDYRWTVELTKQLVFFNPANQAARFLQADALEQLAYSFENATWRNIFLSGAFELRGKLMGNPGLSSTSVFIDNTTEMIKTLTPPYAFEYFSTLIKGIEAQNADLEFRITIGNEWQFVAKLKNGVLRYINNNPSLLKQNQAVPTVISLSFRNMNHFADSFRSNMQRLHDIPTDGETDRMEELYCYFDVLDGNWNIIEPVRKTGIANSGQQ